jgi:hypothetical protein
LPFQALFSGKTIADLPAVLAHLPAIANQLKDAPGTLSTREQRLQRALGIFNAAFTLALIGHGWQLHIQPGECYLQHGGQKFEPLNALTDLQKGRFAPASWNAFCANRGLKHKDIWPILGNKGAASEVLSGRRSISKAQAKRLAEFFNVPADLFI